MEPAPTSTTSSASPIPGLQMRHPQRDAVVANWVRDRRPLRDRRLAGRSRSRHSIRCSGSAIEPPRRRELDSNGALDFTRLSDLLAATSRSAAAPHRHSGGRDSIDPVIGLRLAARSHPARPSSCAATWAGSASRATSNGSDRRLQLRVAVHRATSWPP